MKREDRKARAKSAFVSSINEIARILDAALRETGIPASQKATFLKWTVGTLWEYFKQERMQQRIIIENEIKSQGIRLANGRVTEAYYSKFTLPLDKISNPELVGAEELGLTFDVGSDGECVVSGRPSMIGDYILKLRYNTVEGEEPSELSIPVAFNASSRNLWRDIPTDIHIPYYKEDTAAECIKVPADASGDNKKNVVAASRRGRSHAQEGKARDDHFTLFHCPDSGWYVLAVADGAGSAKFSRKGSQIACDTVVDYCRDRLMGNAEFEEAVIAYGAAPGDRAKLSVLTKMLSEIMYGAAKNAHEAIKRVASDNEGFQFKDFATTLMFAICKKYDFGWYIASFWVGDGAMCLYNKKEGSKKLLGTPDEGEYSGQTRFLTMPEVLKDPDIVQKRIKMTVVPDFTALFLMTDGVSDPMFETDRNLNSDAKWGEFYECLTKGFPEDEIGGVDLSGDSEAAKDQLLEWLNFWSQGNHDDRTIAILY